MFSTLDESETENIHHEGGSSFIFCDRKDEVRKINFSTNNINIGQRKRIVLPIARSCSNSDNQFVKSASSKITFKVRKNKVYKTYLYYWNYVLKKLIVNQHLYFGTIVMKDHYELFVEGNIFVNCKTEEYFVILCQITGGMAKLQSRL